MKHWLKRALLTTALASGALIISAGAASAAPDGQLPVDPEAIIAQTQEALNGNETRQNAGSQAETIQVNVYAPVAVLSHGANKGDVDQSNEAETTAAASNSNETEQKVDQGQAAKVETDPCAKCGPKGGVDQSQKAGNTNTTEQGAEAIAETGQVNVYAPVAVLSHGANKGDVDQSNEAETTAVAANSNETRQSIDQDQAAQVVAGDGWSCAKCGSGAEVNQSQTGANSNRTAQEATAEAKTDQANEVEGRLISLLPVHGSKGHDDARKDDYHGKDAPEVEQSNKAETTAVAANDNGAKQSIDQDQTAKALDRTKAHGIYRPKVDHDEDRHPCNDHKDRDHKDRDHKDRDHKDRDHKGRVEPARHWSARGGGVAQSQTAGNDNTTDQAANATAKTRQLNLYAPFALLSTGSNGGDVDQSNRAETTSVAANDNATVQRIGQLQNALRAI